MCRILYPGYKLNQVPHRFMGGIMSFLVKKTLHFLVESIMEPFRKIRKDHAIPTYPKFETCAF